MSCCFEGRDEGRWARGEDPLPPGQEILTIVPSFLHADEFVAAGKPVPGALRARPSPLVPHPSPWQ